MKKTFLILAALLLMATTGANAQKQYQLYGIGFYNLENLFDTCHDVGHNDYEYLPDGTNRWTGLKYTHKLRNMAQVLSEMGTDRTALKDIGCAAIGVSEVENAKCLADLCEQPVLKARNMQFVHIEGPDQRGVDCALLYNPKLFKVNDVKLVPYIYVKPEDSLRATRGFLTVKGTMAGEDVAIIVNHLPSRFAGSFYREEGGRQIRLVKEELMRENPNVKLFIMGDMNDDPQDKSMSEALGAVRKIKNVEDGGLWNPWWDVLASGTGTLQYDGGWNLFDQIILSKTLLDTHHMKSGKPVDLKKIDCSTLKYFGHQIFRRDYLFQREGRYKGNTKRTHAGGVWLDGYSDHLPTVVYVVKEVK
ncbi:MAG: endonuclease/exonuclease/phosphatase family protein [Prevotella sp.]|nr:endonuclease/exonuclease/phosphatase family protein [Prevotella sp.]